LNEEAEIMELTAKLGGVILKKAELENDFEKVYTKVFEKIFEESTFEIEDVLEIFGSTGG
jgi:hypothetical protein